MGERSRACAGIPSASRAVLLGCVISTLGSFRIWQNLGGDAKMPLSRSELYRRDLGCKRVICWLKTIALLSPRLSCLLTPACPQRSRSQFSAQSIIVTFYSPVRAAQRVTVRTVPLRALQLQTRQLRPLNLHGTCADLGRCLVLVSAAGLTGNVGPVEQLALVACGNQSGFCL